MCARLAWIGGSTKILQRNFFNFKAIEESIDTIGHHQSQQAAHQQHSTTLINNDSKNLEKWIENAIPYKDYIRQGFINAAGAQKTLSRTNNDLFRMCTINSNYQFCRRFVSDRINSGQQIIHLNLFISSNLVIRPCLSCQKIRRTSAYAKMHVAISSIDCRSYCGVISEQMPCFCVAVRSMARA